MGNIYWQDITVLAKVVLTRGVYVVSEPGGKEMVAFWHGNEAEKAESALDGMANKQKEASVIVDRLQSWAADKAGEEADAAKELVEGYVESLGEGKTLDEARDAFQVAHFAQLFED